MPVSMAPYSGQHFHRVRMAQGQDAEKTAVPSEHRTAGEGRLRELGHTCTTLVKVVCVMNQSPEGQTPALSLGDMREEPDDVD